MNRFYFASNKGTDLMTGPMLVSTSKGYAYAKRIAKRKFKEYGYKGKVIHVVPLSA